MLPLSYLLLHTASQVDLKKNPAYKKNRLSCLEFVLVNTDSIGVQIKRTYSISLRA